MKYTNLTKNELIEILKNQQQEIDNKNKKIENQQQEIINKEKELTATKNQLASTEIELRDTRVKLESLILKYDNQHQRELRNIYNKFVSTKETLKHEDECVNEAEVKASPKKGRKAGSKNFTADLIPTRQITKELNEDERICESCGSVMIEIGEDRTKKIIKYPATYEIVEIITKKYACKNSKCNSTIKQAYNDDVFPHSPITPSIAADVINLKYSLAVPLDRYSKYLISQNINISTQCLSNYVLRSAEILTPLYEKLKDCLINNKANVIHADETVLNVLDIKDRVNSYIFVYTTTYYDESIYLYDFSTSRKTDQTEELFKNYHGYLVCDKYAGYDKFKTTLKGIQRCMAHARRYFFDVVKSLNKKERTNSKAIKVVELFDKIFKKEKYFKEKKYTIEEIESSRNTVEYQKLIDDLYDYINQIQAQPGSLLEKAVNYTNNAWDELFTYRKYGYLEPSNNLAERSVKPFVILRKNMLFCKSEYGAIATAKIFSIVQTAKANALAVDKYIEYVLTNINKINIDDLLPWSNKLPKTLKINLTQ